MEIYEFVWGNFLHTCSEQLEAQNCPCGLSLFFGKMKPILMFQVKPSLTIHENETALFVYVRYPLTQKRKTKLFLFSNFK